MERKANRSPSNPARPWVRFNLRAFLIVVMTLSLAVGVWSKRAYDQRLAVRTVERLGGYVVYDTMREATASGTARRAKAGQAAQPSTATEQQTTRNVLQRWLGIDFFDQVVVVNLGNCNLAGEELRILRGLPGLEELYLHSTNVTDADIAHLTPLKQLSVLSLSSTEITKAGARALGSMPSLESVDLAYSQVTASEADKLRKTFHNCRWLHQSTKLPPWSEIVQVIGEAEWLKFGARR